jgi:hypothetical protein
VIQHSEVLSESFVTKPFFARFVYGKLQDLFVIDEKEENPALANIQRGVVSLFQVRISFSFSTFIFYQKLTFQPGCYNLINQQATSIMP